MLFRASKASHFSYCQLSFRCTNEGRSHTVCAYRFVFVTFSPCKMYSAQPMCPAPGGPSPASNQSGGSSCICAPSTAAARGRHRSAAPYRRMPTENSPTVVPLPPSAPSFRQGGAPAQPLWMPRRRQQRALTFKPGQTCAVLALQQSVASPAGCSCHCPGQLFRATKLRKPTSCSIGPLIFEAH